MTSIVENNRAESLVFHIMVDALKEEDIARLRNFVAKYETVIYIHYINEKIFKNLPATDHFTHATYNRFLLPKILNGIVKRVIYIDADILCLGSLSELREMDFHSHVAAVVGDIGAVANRQIKSLKLGKGQYFNAGFLYIDVKEWNDHQVSEQALKVSFDRMGQLDWLDQDALNIVLEGKILFINQRYDYIFDFALKRGVDHLPQEVVFVHYAGRYKPWHAWCMHPLKKDYEKYALISAWKDISPIQPETYKDMKKMARSYMQYGKITLGIVWYIRYACYKIRKIALNR